MRLPSFTAFPRAMRVAGWVLLALYFALAAALLVLRYGVLPNIESWRGDVERALSGALRLPVSIRAIDAHWMGLRPGLAIHGLAIRDAQGRPVLSFDDVEADLSWTSLLRLSPRFSRIEVFAPALDVRRDPQGRLFVAGLEIDTDSKDAGFADWLLAQDRIVVRGAKVTWNDELRGAPPLVLGRLDIDLRNSGSRHRFGLTADPPRELAARLDIRGDLRGELAASQGELYLELDYADLAGWRAWVDYPVELPRGSGGLRLWLGLADGRPKEFTADVRLAGVQLRMKPDLPPLDLEIMEGRLGGRRLGDGVEAHARSLSLATRDGVRLEPVDFDFRWQPPAPGREGRLDASASRLDLTTLRELAKHFPLGAELREWLAALAPRGSLRNLRASWRGDGERSAGYALHAGFEDLGMKAQGALPGFAGLDGRIDGSEKGGVLELASRDAAIEMPAVFAEPLTPFATLDLRASWKADGGVLAATIERAAFRNGDAEGFASGRWRGRAGERGVIDLSAEVRRANGAAVWRYMPLVVNRDARDWLRHAIVGGTASARLRLKGDLSRFPFRDGSGVFEVKGPFAGAKLRYASGWPAFDGVSGSLEFVGPRMTIRADDARLHGVRLSGVKAEIADLEAPEEIMKVTGIARGPTADFLRFVEESPVGERIDRFTADMTAAGEGELDLKLVMNLRHVADTAVTGRYRFLNNALAYDRDLPQLSGVEGELRFTADLLEAKRVRATMLGAPMTLDVATHDGGVTVRAGGTLAVGGLRKQFDHPALEHLSGAAPWNGTIRVRKNAAEVRLESSLAGISSSLPEPFNKSAGSVMPLVFERRPAKGGDQISASLGEAARAQIVRRIGQGGPAVERGAIVERGALAVGAPLPRLPERGVLLLVRGERLDADFWRRLAGGAVDGGRGGGPLVSRADVRVDELVAFDRPFGDFRLTGAREGGVWKGEIRSREAAGEFEWNGAGAGSLTARLSRLALAGAGEAKPAAVGETLRELPAIKLSAKQFQIKGRPLGELDLHAENREDAWHAKVGLRNEDGTLTAAGSWRPDSGGGESRMGFKLAAVSIEKMLARMGYPDAVRRGAATLDGDVSWRGSPAAIDYPTLEGSLKLNAENGQFNRLEPGVGRLLGILSLQSLPRRITLDFRDVFSEGFAFDGIEGRFAIRRGVMETEDLDIQGPAARVFMTGRVDLGRETQDLRVRVQPAVGGTVATGVMLTNPAAGAVVWLADKLLKDPLGKAFAFEYAVTGGWADPKVEKIQSVPIKEETKP